MGASMYRVVGIDRATLHSFGCPASFAWGGRWQPTEEGGLYGGGGRGQGGQAPPELQLKDP